MARPVRQMDLSFLEGWSPDLCWWLGLLLGDGNVYRDDKEGDYRVSLSSPLNVVTKWLAVMGSTKKPLAFNHSLDSYQGYEGGKLLVERLKERFGLDGPKTFSLTWPKGMPVEFTSHFIRGLWDSDGCLSIATEARQSGWLQEFKASYSSATRSFVERLRAELLLRFQVPDNEVFEQLTNTSPSYILSYGGRTALDLARQLYKDAPERLRNEDRYNKYLEMERLLQEHGTACSECGKEYHALRDTLCVACWFAKRPHKVGIDAECGGCGKVKKIVGTGLCSACFTRKRRAEPGWERKSTGTCTCGKPAYRLKMCDACYSKARRVTLRSKQTVGTSQS